MRMNWFYRMILSYTPIFFVVISSMIFIFFLVLNHASQNKFIETNQAILKRMVYHLDANFMLIERNVASELLGESDFQRFFSALDRTAYDDYVLQEKLISLKSSLPFQNTIYIYNEAEKRIISDMGTYLLESFGDREFLLSNLHADSFDSWHDPRSLTYLEGDDPWQVVSLMKVYRDGNDVKGAMVVNVYQESFLEYMNHFNEWDSNAVRMVDPNDAQIEFEPHQIVVKSEYTGWSFVSEGAARGYSTLSFFSSAWMIILAAIIVLALIGFVIVTHIHYRPIQSIMEKVGYVTNRKNEELGIKATKNNEFAFIEAAFDQLLKRSLDYENIHKEENLLRQQRLFHDLIMGHQVYTDEQFKRELAELNLPHEYDRLGVIVVEIDNYARFTEKYKRTDQHLLKFIVEHAFVELGQQNNTFVWRVWIEPHRIAFVMQHKAGDQNSNRPIKEYAKQFQKWINENLELTVTIGVGKDAHSIETIADSFRNAVDNVGLKTIFGINTIIDNHKSSGQKSLNSFAYLKALEHAVHAFKLNEKGWREKLAFIFNELRKMHFVKRDIAVFMNSFVLEMDSSLSSLSSNIQNIWKTDYQQRFSELSLTVETLDELEVKLIQTMTELEQKMEEERQARNHSIALKAKQYIDEHYADPDLSLTRVSDHLGLPPSVLSQLFKEAMGEKFIDYVLKVRMLKAKQLLVETDAPIQVIAEQVGYPNVISFYRAFKKVQDIPPGEYRNMFRTDVND